MVQCCILLQHDHTSLPASSTLLPCVSLSMLQQLLLFTKSLLKRRLCGLIDAFAQSKKVVLFTDLFQLKPNWHRGAKTSLMKHLAPQIKDSSSAADKFCHLSTALSIDGAMDSPSNNRLQGGPCRSTAAMVCHSDGSLWRGASVEAGNIPWQNAMLAMVSPGNLHCQHCSMLH